MIRINLLGQNVAAAKFSAPSASEEEKEAAKKIGILFVFPLLLYFFEIYNLGELKSQLNKETNDAAVVQSALTQKKEVSKEAVRLQEELKVVQSKIDAIRTLSKSRLRELRAFDTLQTIIPEKVWFSDLNYRDEKMEITGLAIDDEDLTLFLKAMQERPYFSRVILKKAQDKKVDSGVLKEFFIECNLESAE